MTGVNMLVADAIILARVTQSNIEERLKTVLFVLWPFYVLWYKKAFKLADSIIICGEETDTPYIFMEARDLQILRRLR